MKNFEIMVRPWKGGYGSRGANLDSLLATLAPTLRVGTHFLTLRVEEAPAIRFLTAIRVAAERPD
jgi:hypothetical protein